MKLLAIGLLVAGMVLMLLSSQGAMTAGPWIGRRLAHRAVVQATGKLEAGLTPAGVHRMGMFDGRRGKTSGEAAPGSGASVSRMRRFLRLGKESAPQHVPIELLVTDVASLLRAGAAPGEAWWNGAEVRVDQFGVPLPEALAVRLGADRGRAAEVARRAQAEGIVAACTVAREVGAPLAPVLESVARSVVLAAEGRTEREAALAGPRTTARLLAWLPVLGLGFGTLLGADPLAFVLGSPAGLATGIVGGGLMVMGRRWIRRLIDTAARDGELA